MAAAIDREHQAVVRDRLSGWDQPSLVQGKGDLEKSGWQAGNDVWRGTAVPRAARICREEPGHIPNSIAAPPSSPFSKRRQRRGRGLFRSLI